MNTEEEVNKLYVIGITLVAYISEIAPAKYRGALATIQQVTIIAGCSFNYQLADISGSVLNRIVTNK